MDLRALLTLLNIPGIGPVRARRLVEYFSSPEEVLSAGKQALDAVRDIGEKTVEALANPDYRFADVQIKKLEDCGGKIVTFWDEAYPPLLKEIYDPPLVLYIMGNIDALRTQAIAIVGTRIPSQYGRANAVCIAEELANRNYTIVSGMARGIDTEAHKGALKASGRTIAVLGCGLDIVYPRENKDLRQAITLQGAVISEFPLGSSPDGRNFPRRNRIISGLSKGTLIIEAGIRSGALITAAYAADQNREVFALPGDINRPRSQGCNRLIHNQMASLVTSADDILEILGCKYEAGQKELFKEPPKIEGVQLMIYNNLDLEPIYIDDLAQKVNMNTSEILTVLLEMELEGLVKSLPGKNYVRI